MLNVFKFNCKDTKNNNKEHVIAVDLIDVFRISRMEMFYDKTGLKNLTKFIEMQWNGILYLVAFLARACSLTKHRNTL